jgi:hypothetical protein
MAGSARVVAFLVLLACLGVGLWFVRWELNERRAGGDAFWYSRAAFGFAGSSPGEATREAADVMVAYRGQEAGGWLTAPETVDPRYQRIFVARPLYPLVAAPFVPVLGIDAMVAAALLGGTCLAVVIGWSAWHLTRSRPVAAAAALFVFALPSGQFIAYLAPEGWMLALWAAGLAVASLQLADPRPGRLGLLAVATALLVVTKSPNAAVLAVALMVVALVAWRLDWPERRPALQAASVASAVVAGQAVVNAALGLPGFLDSVQDVLTDHFTQPDVESPMLALAAFDLRQLPRWLTGLVGAPIELLLVVGGAVALARSGARWAIVWIVGGLATLLVVLAHPVTSEIPRLLAPIWASVALGLAVGLARLAGRAGARDAFGRST